MKKQNIVTIGGGTGTFALLSGLKKYDFLNLEAIVTVTDSGGSTGKLRDEFGFLPIGDIRQCIVALAEDGNGTNILRDLFNYRFQKGGTGLEGHSFGNLFITAITDLMEGDQLRAIDYVSKILRIKGKVIPVSLDNIDIAVEQEDGTVTVGETNIKDNYEKRNIASKIVRSWLQPKAKATQRALDAIINADLIIIGPGGLYTSLIANLMVDGIKEAILSSKAKVLYNTNLMTDAGQTHNMTTMQHVNVITKYIGKIPDFIIKNNAKLPEDIVKKYEESDDFPVVDDLEKIEGSIIIEEDLIAGSGEIQKKKDFGAKRSLIRHNSYTISDIIVKKILPQINELS